MTTEQDVVASENTYRIISPMSVLSKVHDAHTLAWVPNGGNCGENRAKYVDKGGGQMFDNLASKYRIQS